MANTNKNNLGIGRGRGRARGMTPYTTPNQQPHIKPDSVFAHSSIESSQNSATVSLDSVSIYDPGAGGDTLKNSRLSAEAVEFYPRNYKADTKVSGEMQAPATDEEERIQPSEAVDRLLDIVNSVTVEPGTYKSAVQPFLEYFGSLVIDSDVLSLMLNIIIEQSIVQPNFRYNGARLCNDLTVFLADSKPEFRSDLLQRCREEFNEALKCFESKPGQLHGVLCFLAELYIQLELKPGNRLRILGDALYELLHMLVSSPVPDNIKCACMTLKLAGYALDQDNSTAMDTLMQSLHKVASSPSVDTRVAAMVKNIEQLRLTSWGANSMTESSSSGTDFSPSTVVQETEPVFYGPDGIVLTREESSFLQENLGPELECDEELWVNGSYSEYDCDGEMNEEEEEAYEEFLRMSENNKKH